MPFLLGQLPLSPLPLLVVQVVVAGGVYLLSACALICLWRRDLLGMLSIFRTGEKDAAA